MNDPITDFQRRRASNQIWNAAGRYDFSPDFRSYQADGTADLYWNSLFGLARKHYDYEKLKKLFDGLENEEEAGDYAALLWLGLENALVEKEAATRPFLRELQRDYAGQFLRSLSGAEAEDDRFFDFLARAHYRKILGKALPKSRYDKQLLEELEFSPALSTEELVLQAQALLQKWFAIRLKEKKEQRSFSLPLIPALRHRRKKGAGRLVRFGQGLRELPVFSSGGRELLHDPEGFRTDLNPTELRLFMEEKFGRSLLRPEETAMLEKRLCSGRHRDCHLHLSGGEPVEEMQIRNGFEALQKQREERQTALNREAFHREEAANRIAISRLTERIRNSVLLYLEEADVRTDSGRLEAARAWRATVMDERSVFLRRENDNAGNVSVDLLLDGSTSQKGRLEVISGQAFCIAEALTRCAIPCRILSFCSMTGYTILRIYRDYLSPEDNDKVFDYVANGCNRDGLAIRLMGELMEASPCEHRLLILLSDARPQDVVKLFSEERGDYSPYEGETSVRDTAYEVRLLRAEGIAVICVFTGEDEDLPAAATIYGRDFVRVRKIDQLADTVGLLIQNQIKNL